MDSKSENYRSLDKSDSMPMAAEAEGGEVMTSLPKGFENAALQRKIIYTADHDLVVEDIEQFDDSIKDLVQQYKGIIAGGNISGRKNGHRRGRWRLRIPVDNFEAFLDDVAELGETTGVSRDSKDVTEEYVDLEARIKSKKALAESVRKLLDRPNDKLSHVIELKREMERIQSEIERMEGRMRFLNDRIDLTTVTINASEEKDFQPTQSLPLGNRIGNSWNDSLTNLSSGAGNFVVWFVGAIPWLIIWAILLLIAYGIYRIVRAKRSRAQVTEY